MAQQPDGSLQNPAVVTKTEDEDVSERGEA